MVFISKFRRNLTLAQSILLGWSTFWLASRKSTTGPGFTIIVVETSAQLSSSCKYELSPNLKCCHKIIYRTALIDNKHTNIKRKPALCGSKA